MKCSATILFGLLTIWTGLLRGIEAQAYKPSALWFCLVMGLLAIAAGYLYRLERRTAATALAGSSGAMVLSFYLHAFITAPAEDATVRVGVVIVGAIAHLAITYLPTPPRSPSEASR